MWTGTAQWMAWRGGVDRRGKWDPLLFREALHLRLLINPFPYSGNLVCADCGNISIGASPLHPLHCMRVHNARDRRHNIVRDSLVECLKECYAGENMSIIVEHKMQGESGRYEADIWWSHNGVRYIIDVGITDPAAPTYLREADSASCADAAAKRYETTKRDDFLSRGIRDHKFVPFILETTGRMGPAARTFFQTAVENQGSRASSAGKRFLRRMSATIMRGNAMIIQSARNRFHQSAVRGLGRGADRGRGERDTRR